MKKQKKKKTEKLRLVFSQKPYDFTNKVTYLFSFYALFFEECPFFLHFSIFKELCVLRSKMMLQNLLFCL